MSHLNVFLNVLSPNFAATMGNPEKYAALIKLKAKSLGFDFCGISKAGFLDTEAKRMEKWLNDGHHGQMYYLENHFDKRLDPTLLVPDAKSVVSLMYNYFPAEMQNQDTFKIARYAYGKDYHKVVKDKCFELVEQLRHEIGDIEGRVFVDSAPVLERAWAQKSGLGWIGKHGLLINKQMGSFFFLAELVIDLECAADSPIKDYCGSCNKCVEACPTEAILPNKTLDAKRCISYLTIELKEQIPSEFNGKYNDWIFGCDICQEVCPWNRFSQTHHEPLFNINTEWQTMNKQDWEDLNNEKFNQLFEGSAVKRTGYEGLKRNIAYLTKKK
jgi:epoxyqueuosine reductase